MVTGTMPLPEGAKPGSKLSVALPSGEMIVVVVPREASPGKDFTFGFHQPKRDKGLPPRHDGRMLEHEFTVPEGLTPGAVMAVLALPWGQEIDLKVPEGCKPGETFALKIPVPEGFGKDPNVYERTIKVPPNWDPSQGTVGFKLPWGEVLNLKVPKEAKVGDDLMIEIPFPASYSPPWRKQHEAKVARDAANAAAVAAAAAAEEVKEGEGGGAATVAADPPASPAKTGDKKKKKKKGKA